MKTVHIMPYYKTVGANSIATDWFINGHLLRCLMFSRKSTLLALKAMSAFIFFKLGDRLSCGLHATHKIIDPQAISAVLS